MYIYVIARDHKACVSAKTDRHADLSSEELLNKIVEDDAARAVFYLRIKQFQLEIYFQKQHVLPT